MLSVDAVPATILEEDPDEDVVLVATEAAEAVVVEPVLEVEFVVAVPFWDIASCSKSACDFAAVGFTEKTIPLPQWPVCLQYIPESSN